MENELIERIVQNAENIAEGTLREAQAKAAAAIEEAKALAMKWEIENNGKIEGERENILARAKTVAELDANKLIQKTRVDCVEDCFEGALLELAKLKDKEYLSFIRKLLVAYAEDGDTVVICERDAKRITAAFIKEVAAAQKIKLTLSKKYGKFAGGVILENNGVDKNLTFEMQLKEAKPGLTGKVIELLQI